MKMIPSQLKEKLLTKQTLTKTEFNSLPTKLKELVRSKHIKALAVYLDQLELLEKSH